MKLEDVILSEIGQSQKDLLYANEVSKIVRFKEWGGGCQGLEGGGNGDHSLMGIM